jgi:sugar phosphate isomerase/epimerase
MSDAIRREKFMQIGSLNRRAFLAASLATAAVACTPQQAPKAAGPKRGVGLFSLPKMLEEDFAGAIAMLAKLGYKEIETFGPYEFSDPEQIANWAKVVPSLGFSGSGFFGKTLSEVQAILKGEGMAVPSMHTDIHTLQSRMGPLAEAAKALGATYVTLPAIPDEFRKDLDGYKRTADLFNSIGDSAVKHGVKFAYHNHGYGLKPMADGTVPLDVLLAATDPAKVLLEMDVFWTVAGGADPVAYIKKHSGRYRMFHLKDMKTIRTFTGDGGGPDQWIPLFDSMTSLGQGAIDIKAIIEAAKANGGEHYFVEQDRAADPKAQLGASSRYLEGLGFV